MNEKDIIELALTPDPKPPPPPPTEAEKVIDGLLVELGGPPSPMPNAGTLGGVPGVPPDQGQVTIGPAVYPSAYPNLHKLLEEENAALRKELHELPVSKDPWWMRAIAWVERKLPI
jgi:hypothetical protein